MKRSGKKNSSDRRQDIINAAIVCFVKYGIVGTSFSQIAKQAKVHQPLISYYFEDFNSLYVAIVNVLLEDLRNLSISAIAKHPNDPEKALLDYAEIPLVWSRERPQYNALWTFFYHLASYNPQFQAINNLIRKTGQERISLLLYRYQEAKGLKLRPEWTINDLAYSIQAHITGVLTQTVTEGSDREAAAKLTQRALSVLLAGAFE